MTVIKKTAIVPYQPAELYDLVNDIKKYPEFLPWCDKTSVEKQDEDEIHATLHIKKGAFNKAFSTCNRLQTNKMIEIRLLNGPFKRLEGFWSFEPLQDQGCKINFHLEFEFANRLMSMAAGPVFSQLANSLVDSFCQRAKTLYQDK